MTDKEVFVDFWTKWSNPIVGYTPEVLDTESQLRKKYGKELFSNMIWQVLKEEAREARKVLDEHPELDYTEDESRNDEKELAQWNAYKDVVINWIVENFDGFTDPKNYE